MTAIEETTTWEQLYQVPEWVKEAASLYATVPGLNTASLASYLNKSKELVEASLASKPVVQYIGELRIQIIRQRKAPEEALTRMREVSYDQILERILSGEMADKDLISAAKFSSDYHPDRHFTKMEKREERVTHEHRATGALMESLHKRHLEAIKPKQIVGEVVDDDEPQEAPHIEVVDSETQ